MSNTVVEVDIQVRNLSAALNLPMPLEGPITLEGVVPINSKTYLEYWTAPPEITDVLSDVPDASHIEAIEVLKETEERVRLEVRVAEPLLVMALVSQNGYIKHAQIEDNDCRLTAQLPVGTDIRRIRDAVKEQYPNSRVMAQRQVSRSETSPGRVRSTLEDELTDRQRTVLEAAHYGGFFNWPRDRSGEEIAESLDISSPTFHQHLRLGEQKLFEALFDTQPSA
ncbi:bacterio-opsin activator domain-containing protein [Haloferacaceae archaeon DSL9]